MQNPEKAGGADFEKTKGAVRGIIERIRSLEHPDWQQKEDDIGALKAAIAKYTSELEHLTFRYDARCGELNKLKGQYAELERKFLMRPEAMRRAGEMEITDLVRQKHDLAALEAALEQRRGELSAEKEGLEKEMRERAGARLAEIERAHAELEAQLKTRAENLALREKETAEAEKRLKQLIEERRREAVEELSASFSSERQAAEAAALKEKNLLSEEASAWRHRAGEALAQLESERRRAEELEKAAEAARQTAAGAGQGRRLAEMEKEALAKRLEEWEKKGHELEKTRSEESGREIETLRARAGEALAQLDEARRRAETLEKAAAESREAAAEAGQKCRLAELEKSAMARRIEDWEKQGPELEKWRAELLAREAKCRQIEETAGRETRPLAERISSLELELKDNKQELEKWRQKAEASHAQAEQARRRVDELEKALAAEREQAAAAGQGRRLAEMEKEAFAKRVEEWEKKGPELEQLRAEAGEREQRARQESRSLVEKIADLEGRLLESEKAAAQARLRAESEVPAAEAKLSAERDRAAALEQELAKVKDHFGKTLAEVAVLQEQIAAEKEKHIRAEAQKDAERTRKMEELLAEMAAREKALEEGWARRHRALEAEQKGYHEEFERRHAAMLEDLKTGMAGAEKLYVQKEAKLLELNKRFMEEFQDREAKARAVEEELRARAAGLESAAAGLAREYDQKAAALEALRKEILAQLPRGTQEELK